MTPTPETSPRPSVREMQGRLAAELAPGPRILFVLLLLFDLAVATVIASVWLTEPALPARTHAAFGLLLAIAVAWAVFFARILTRRRVLLARQRLLAGRLATTFTAAFTLGALVLALLEPAQRETGFAAAGFGVLLCAVAFLVLRRARERFDALWARRRDLEDGLAAS